MTLLQGADISKWQGRLQAGPFLSALQELDFVFLRASYGTRSDRHFRDNWRALWKSGPKLGAYHFFRHQQSPADQFESLAGELEAVGGPGHISPALDLEDNAKFDGPFSIGEYVDDALELAQLIAAEFGGCIIYTGPAFFSSLERGSKGRALELLQYPIWIAHYTSDERPSWPHKWDVWQYTDAGPTGGEFIDRNVAKRLPLVGASSSTPASAELIAEGADLTRQIEGCVTSCCRGRTARLREIFAELNRGA